MNYRIAIVAGFLAIAIVFGGGGSPAPLAELVVQLAAVAALIAWQFAKPPAMPPDRLMFWCVAAFVLLPVLQLIPLPPEIWHRLPGRGAEIASLALVDADRQWMPLSVAPWATLASLLSLVPPVVMILLISRLALAERMKIVAVVAALAGLGALVGLLQISSGDANALRLYEHTHEGFATGFQANRNAQADLILIGLMALFSVAAVHREWWLDKIANRAALAAAAAVLVLSVIVTGSRAGIGLLVITMAALAGLTIWHRRWRPGRNLGLGAAAILVAFAALALQHNARIEKTFDRFSETENARAATIWPDAVHSARTHMPTGTGLGTFVPVFKADERLEVVDRSRPNRAHNDYLEFVLEGGVLACALLLIAAVAIGWRTLSILRNSGSNRRRIQALFAAGTLCVLGLHSIVDYPMRTMSLATLAALSLGLLTSVSASGAKVGRHSARHDEMDSHSTMNMKVWSPAALSVPLALLSACSTSISPALPRGAAAYDVISPLAANASPREYRIGPLDTLNITVFQEPSLSFAALPVDASGSITMPLIGAVRAEGQTAHELSQSIANKLNSRFLKNAQVSVVVVSSVSQRVTVEGNVVQPGIYEIGGPSSLLQALALAQSPTRVADLDEVVIFRVVDGRRMGAVFDVEKIRAGEAPDPEIRGGDVVVVGFDAVKGAFRDFLQAAPLFNIFRYF